MPPAAPLTHISTCGVKDAGAPCTGISPTRPLRTLFTLVFPKVHAADIAEPQANLDSLPKLLGKPEFPDTGWDRIKDLFDRRDGQPYSDEVRSVAKSAITAALVGLCYGGLPGARHSRERFIQLNQAEIYRSRVEAVRSAHNAAIRGFVRYGWRWSWRMAAFVTLFNTVSTGLSVYGDSNALSHFGVAGAVTGGLFRLNLGLRGLVAGSAIGAALGMPAGALIVGLQKLSGETMREKRRRECRELFELKVAEWNSRLQLTDDLIGEFSGQDQDTEGDLNRIQQLLSQPRNEDMGKGSSSQ
ncbi:complex I assembly factor TIMMDC1, mitochondrial [Trichomycterus rosablanca]|uniref:complex I assembly factor TIMMDC1, mitochondrial n=1 Tax=Trichomycterus rosablanca TaxID=2290929 RepID=UPI002F35E1D0